MVIRITVMHYIGSEIQCTEIVKISSRLAHHMVWFKYKKRAWQISKYPPLRAIGCL